MVADDNALRQMLQADCGRAAERCAAYFDQHDQRWLGGRLEETASGAATALCVGPRYSEARKRRPQKALGGGAWNSDAVAKARPVLEAVSQQMVEIGEDPVQANITKISGNFLIAAAMEAMGEAVALVGRHGVNPVQYMEFLTTTLFAAPIYKTYGTGSPSRNMSPWASARHWV